MQIDLMFAFFAVVLVIAWLIVDLGSADRKIGYWGMAIGAIAVFVGTILMVARRQHRTGHAAAGDSTAAVAARRLSALSDW